MKKAQPMLQRLGWSLAACVLVVTPAMAAAPASTTATANAVVLAAASTPSAKTVAKHGSRHGYRHGRSHRYYGGHRGHYRGYGRFGFYAHPFYYGGHYGPYGRYPHRTPRYRASNVEQLGALDFDVKPKAAEIFLDGQAIGTVGQFDGFPDYLWLEEGTYEVAVYLDGYQTLERTYRIYPGLVIDVDGRLAQGASERPAEPVAAAPISSANPPPGVLVEPSATAGTKGRLLVTVWPVDAAVYLDGHFLGIAQELGHVSAGLLVDAGRHTIEVARPGFRGVTREVEITGDERFELDVKLQER